MSIPIPDDTWNVPVDADGNLIVARALREGDFLARAPIEFPLPETVSFDENRPHDIQAAENVKTFERAIFDLSQSNVGRHLLELARDLKIRFVFDREATLKQDAALLNDDSRNEIIIRPGTNALDLSVFIAHEIQHREDISVKRFDYFNDDSLPTAIRIRRTQEANARVTEAFHIFECAIDRSGDNPARYKPKYSPEFLERVFKPAVAVGVRQAWDYASEGEWKIAAQLVFKSFFNIESLAYYDKGPLTQFLDWWEKNTITSPYPAFMSYNRMEHREIAAIISVNGIYYLQGETFLDDRQFNTLSAAENVQAFYRELKEKIEALGPGHPCHPVIDWEPREPMPLTIQPQRRRLTSGDAAAPAAVMAGMLQLGALQYNELAMPS